MAQRGFRMSDPEIIMLIGTEVEGGFLVREKDCREAEQVVQGVLHRIRRSRGKRLVIASGKIVTAYRASRKQRRGLVRGAYESDLR